jgi:hypothetical protein
MINRFYVSLTGVLGIETISWIQLESGVKIICQIVVTLITVYYLVKNNKNQK